MSRIGVFICQCGVNIAEKVDTEKVAEEISKLPSVEHATDYKFMCSSPGQKLIKDAINEHGLDRVIVAACSPQMHQQTFQRAIESEGLNPYFLSIANIREQCSWVTEDPEKATEKAINLVRKKVKRVTHHDSLEDIEVPITKKALIVGGGIAGIQAALDIAESGKEVILVEREPSLGGRMAQLDETFPTLDCSQCILTPKMVEADQHPNIDIRVNSEVKNVEGYVGNFEVTIRRKATYVNSEKCIGCGVCEEKCPTENVPDKFNVEMDEHSAIYRPFPQAVPSVPVIDPDHCQNIQKGKCGVCEKVCPKDAIEFEDEGEETSVEVGAIIAATGYQEMDPSVYTEYGVEKYEDVITGLQFERLVSSTGPTGGEIKRPSDGREPEKIVFVQCVGSRDESKGHEYCSGICCMYTAKHALLYKKHVPDGQAYVSYIDIRAPGKRYDEFTRRAIEDEGVRYLRGRVGQIKKKDDKYRVYTEDSLAGNPVSIDADMVVLASAVEPRDDAESLAQKLGIPYDQDGFFSEAHPKLRPVETTTAGIFIAGACEGPKDIPTSVQQGSGAASKVHSLFSKENLSKQPNIASTDPTRCSGCFDCSEVCNYDAIEKTEFAGKEVADIVEGKCQGCGVCASTCRNGAIDVFGFRDDELLEEIVA